MKSKKIARQPGKRGYLREKKSRAPRRSASNLARVLTLISLPNLKSNGKTLDIIKFIDDYKYLLRAISEIFLPRNKCVLKKYYFLLRKRKF